MICNIIDFGAKISDLLQTEAIQAAVDQCFLSGGGEVVIPGGVWRTGCIRLRSNVTLHLLTGAILEGSDNPEDYTGYISDTIEPIDVYEQGETSRSIYPFSRWNNGLIRAIDAENVSIVGEPYSYIDGIDCYDSVGEENYRGPHCIKMHNCKNITLSGYTIRRSANWAHNLTLCDNISIDNVTVYGGHDGFDVFKCNNVNIINCNFYTGDDCIAGFDNVDVTIRDCTLNCACNAIRFGGTNVLAENCKFTSPGHFGHRWALSPEDKSRRKTATEADNHNMLAAFCYYCDKRTNVRNAPGNIVIRNCSIENPGTLYTHDFGFYWTCNRELESIRFENCKISGMTAPIMHYGDIDNKKMVMEFDNVIFENTNCDVFIKAKNFDTIVLKNVTLDAGANRTIITDGTGGNIIIENSGEFEQTVGELKGYGEE